MPARRRPKNFAFIDSQNIHLGVQALGWRLDWLRFRVYLREKYGVSNAYLFIGYVPRNQRLYRFLERAGYLLMFKPLSPVGRGETKANVDADLVLKAMVEYDAYEKAVLVTSDGDFYSLAAHLYRNGKLEAVLSPSSATCSALLKKAAKERIYFLDNLRTELEYGRDADNNEGAPPRDETQGSTPSS